MQLMNQTKIFLISILAIGAIILLLFLPLMIFRFGVVSEIFPAVEIMIVYYISLNYKIRYWHLFLVGIVVDQFYYFPLGLSSLTFILANILLEKLRKLVLLKALVIHFIVFCTYVLFVMSCRYLLIFDKNFYPPNVIVIFFQSCTTIFSYPILKKFFDKFLYSLKQYVE